jgi:hypothetical protein
MHNQIKDDLEEERNQREWLSTLGGEEELEEQKEDGVVKDKESSETLAKSRCAN